MKILKTGESLTIQSVERALDILETICDKGNAMSAIEISKALNINRTTIYGLLNTLIKKNYIIKGDEGKFSITVKLFQLGSHYIRKLPMLLQVFPSISEMFNRHDVAVRLAQRFEKDQVILLEAKEPLRYRTIRAGEVVPFYSTGLGKAIYAFLSTDELREVVNSTKMHRYTATTITDRDALWEELGRIREIGYSIDKGEYMDNTYCLGFPLRDSEGRVLAAFSFSDTKEIMESKQEELIRDGLQTSKFLSADLGWRPFK
jgi:DNA-binding IclR family transcriptional regulator